MSDDEFSSLKPSLRRAIDTTFLKLVKQSGEASGEPVRKKQRTEEEEGGGFVEDGSDSGSNHDQDKDSSIPLSLVPTGLQMLDLPPDDPEVLAVFRNAATGWENARARPRGDGDEAPDRDAGLSVSKEDWRAVCAVLLGQAQEEEKPEPASGSRRKRSPAQPRSATGEGRQTRSKGKAKAKDPDPESDPEEGGGFVVDRDEEAEDEEGGGFDLDEEDPGSDSDKYSESDDGDASSASEFGAQPKTTRAKKVEGEEDDSDMETDDMPLTLTERQKREARFAFALFFPDMDPNDPALNTKKIGIREVGDAAKSLKEKLSTDDIIEMLSMFSSGPSGVVGLEEFSRMAVMAKLV